MATNAENLVPAKATHPGRILLRELQSRGIKQKDFALTLGIPAPNLNEIVKGKRNITEATAQKLEEALGVSFSFWMNLQNNYNRASLLIRNAEQADEQAEREWRSLDSRINLQALCRALGIRLSHHISVMLGAIRAVIDISLDGLQKAEVQTSGYFKRSDLLKTDGRNMRTWLLLARHEADKACPSGVFTETSAPDAAREIASLANRNTLTLADISRILGEYGIGYAHVPKLDGTPVDAFSTMTGHGPVVVATYRHDDMDKLAFDVLHELAHIRFHMGQGRSFIKIDTGENYSKDSTEEREADVFARDTLIPVSVWKDILSDGGFSLDPSIAVRRIAANAERHGISPSIAVARYKHDTRIYAVRGFRPAKIH